MPLKPEDAGALLDGSGYPFSEAERSALIEDATVRRDLFAAQTHRATVEAAARANPNDYTALLRAVLARAAEDAARTLAEDPNELLLNVARGFKATDPLHSERIEHALEESKKEEAATAAAVRDMDAQHERFRKRLLEGRAQIDQLTDRLRGLPPHSRDAQELMRQIADTRRQLEVPDALEAF